MPGSATPIPSRDARRGPLRGVRRAAFSFDELVARIRAHLRIPSQAEATVLEAGNIKMIAWSAA
jgi:hypothetical protein